MTGNRLLEAKDVAALLAVPVSWVRQATRAGQLPHVRLGSYVRYDADDVRAWLNAQKQGGRPRAGRRYHPEVTP